MMYLSNIILTYNSQKKTPSPPIKVWGTTSKGGGDLGPTPASMQKI